MKKKSQTKDSAVLDTVEKEEKNKQQQLPGSQMNEEEFDRYIDNIMAENKPQEQDEQPEEKDVSESAGEDTLLSIKNDIKKLADALGGFMQVVGPKLADKAEVFASAPQGVDEGAKLDIAKKAQMYDALMRQKQQNESIRRRLFKQAEDLKKSYEDFDLRTLYNTQPDFKSELDRTGSVYGAYLKYLAGKLAATGGINPSRNFMENGAMPNLSAGSITTSPAGLPDKEFDDYIRNILGQA